jgi:hypothetical protein
MNDKEDMYSRVVHIDTISTGFSREHYIGFYVLYVTLEKPRKRSK